MPEQASDFRSCPFCNEQIKLKAIICRHCKSSLVNCTQLISTGLTASVSASLEALPVPKVRIASAISNVPTHVPLTKMSDSGTTSHENINCKFCEAVLPKSAKFCNSCGEQVASQNKEDALMVKTERKFIRAEVPEIKAAQQSSRTSARDDAAYGRECPECAETIATSTTHCWHCKSKIIPTEKASLKSTSYASKKLLEKAANESKAVWAQSKVSNPEFTNAVKFVSKQQWQAAAIVVILVIGISSFHFGPGVTVNGDTGTMSVTLRSGDHADYEASKIAKAIFAAAKQHQELKQIVMNCKMSSDLLVDKYGNNATGGDRVMGAITVSDLDEVRKYRTDVDYAESTSGLCLPYTLRNMTYGDYLKQ